MVAVALWLIAPREVEAGGLGLAKIVASDAGAEENFGSALALHCDTLAVGAYTDDDREPYSGSVSDDMEPSRPVT